MSNGKNVDSALPSTPVEILGMNKSALAGDDFIVVDSEKNPISNNILFCIFFGGFGILSLLEISYYKFIIATIIWSIFVYLIEGEWLYFIPLIFIGANRTYLDTVAVGRYFPKLKELLQMMTTFLIISFSWIFFRAESMFHALDYIKRIASIDAYNNWAGNHINSEEFSEIIEILPILFHQY